ncbi:hypothetical protein Oscil6304_2784 [Oscillatoria acuminata PCC 6304]|uniref:Uncharacterized protein n=1 Tax=Oscillatoria acuminata PCC 6304 TaxID=56110 RepID=K9TJR4_9CYAN|nr:hypothetical protein Oscil6304_2784 [Oscillatoria acuminata PCC 6304]
MSVAGFNQNPHPQGWGYTDQACLRRLQEYCWVFQNGIWYHLTPFLGVKILDYRLLFHPDNPTAQNFSLISVYSC